MMNRKSIFAKETARRLGCVVLGLILFSVKMTACKLAEAASWEREVKIPFLTILTGLRASVGRYITESCKMSVEHINAKGGIGGKPIVLDTYDTGYDAARAVSFFRQVSDKALLVTGPMYSIEAESVAPVANTIGVPTIFYACSKISVAAANRPWTFTTYADIMSMGIDATVRWAKLNPQVKRVVIHADQKDAAARTQTDAVRKGLEAAGIEILETIYMTSGDVDFAAQTTRAKALKPDAIIYGMLGTECGMMLREAQKQGIKANIFLILSAFSEAPVWETASSAMEGVWSYSDIWEENPLPKFQTVRKEFIARSGGTVFSAGGACSYETWWIIKDAWERAGITGNPEKVKEERVRLRDAIASTKGLNLLDREVTMGPNGYVIRSGYLLRVKNMKIEKVK